MRCEGEGGCGVKGQWGGGGRLVVGVDGEGAALQHVAEVADAGDTGEELSIKGGIPHLCRLKLFREILIIFIEGGYIINIYKYKY